MRTYNPYSLEGRTILITGASSGIGRQTAIECAALGATIVLTGRNKQRLDETYALLDGYGHLSIVADISQDGSIAELVDLCPKIDGFVCNAGIGSTKPALFYKREEVEDMFNVNTLAAVLLTKTLIKKKKLVNNSSIVYTSSIEGTFTTSIGNGIYGMSKAALSAYMKTVALELSNKGIRCNTVNPGMVRTPLIAADGAISEEQQALDMQKYPLGRYGEPKDIALAIVYLLSNASSWVTGTEFKIDGGFSLV